MKIFVTGVGGQLGYDVLNELKRRGYDCVGSDIIEKSDENYVQLDIIDKAAVNTVLSGKNFTRLFIVPRRLRLLQWRTKKIRRRLVSQRKHVDAI